MGFHQIPDAYAATFPDSKISVRLFDRKLLVGEDIFSDFMSQAVPKIALEDLPLSTRKTSNESISAESMLFLQQFRRRFFSDQDDIFNKQTSSIIQALRVVEKSGDFPKPELQPAIRDYANYNSIGSLELRHRYGIVFPEYDYGRLERGELADKPDFSGDVSDIVSIDQDRLGNLIRGLLANDVQLDRKTRNWLNSLRPSSSRLSFFSAMKRLFNSEV